MTYSTTVKSEYYYLWSKYRPAILKLMVDSAESPQEYKFSKHEFHNINAKEKGGHSFVLRVFQAKAVNDIKTSIVAKELMEILKLSRKATELTESATYEISLDKQYVLHITQEKKEEEETPEDDSNQDDTAPEEPAKEESKD